jgi:hypothetical protein
MAELEMNCCGPEGCEPCGCAPAETADIREQVRERYAAAALQVTSTGPGVGCCAPGETFDGASEV